MALFAEIFSKTKNLKSLKIGEVSITNYNNYYKDEVRVSMRDDDDESDARDSLDKEMTLDNRYLITSDTIDYIEFLKYFNLEYKNMYEHIIKRDNNIELREILIEYGEHIKIIEVTDGYKTIKFENGIITTTYCTKEEISLDTYLSIGYKSARK